MSYTRLCRRYSAFGEELLKYTASFPSKEEYPALGELYSQGAEALEKYCAEQEFKALKDQYSCTPRTKHKKTVCQYLCEIKNESARRINVSLRISYSRGKELISARSFLHIWVELNGVWLIKKASEINTPEPPL